MADNFRPYFDYPSRGNLLCCLPDCGVRRKLLCVKNGKFVRHPRDCLKVWNGNRCNASCCGRNKCGEGRENRDGGDWDIEDRQWWRRCDNTANCGGRRCCGRFGNF